VKNKYKLLYIVSFVFLVIFFIKVIENYLNRESFITVTLAFAIKLDILFLLVPAVILFIIAFLLGKRKH
jgi:hypothetical protein